MGEVLGRRPDLPACYENEFVHEFTDYLPVDGCTKGKYPGDDDEAVIPKDSFEGFYTSENSNS